MLVKKGKPLHSVQFANRRICEAIGESEMGLVAVFRFQRGYDIATDKLELSSNMATREFIVASGGNVIDESITIVDERDVDGVGVLLGSTKVIHCPCCGAGMFRPGRKPDPAFEADRFGTFVVCWQCKKRANFIRDPSGPDVTFKLSVQQPCG